MLTRQCVPRCLPQCLLTVRLLSCARRRLVGSNLSSERPQKQPSMEVRVPPSLEYPHRSWSAVGLRIMPPRWPSANGIGMTRPPV
eukprot:scaffold39135_cov66-Phaeocystis_antarctica.AAC.5